MTRRGWLLFSALCLIWGIPYLLIRVAVGEFHPLVVAFGRTLIGGLLLLPIALRRGALRPLLRHWKVLVVYTVIEISGPWLLLGYAETRLTTSTAGLLIATVPLITAVLLAASGGERIRPPGAPSAWSPDSRGCWCWSGWTSTSPTSARWQLWPAPRSATRSAPS